MAEWTDDPAVRDALTRAPDIAAILALPEETARIALAERGLYPVSVAHGDLDSDQAVQLISRRMAEAAPATRAAATTPLPAW